MTRQLRVMMMILMKIGRTTTQMEANLLRSRTPSVKKVVAAVTVTATTAATVRPAE
jgi:hypothetical protein